jgi:hypothetical protein
MSNLESTNTIAFVPFRDFARTHEDVILHATIAAFRLFWQLKERLNSMAEERAEQVRQ